MEMHLPAEALSSRKDRFNLKKLSFEALFKKKRRPTKRGEEERQTAREKESVSFPPVSLTNAELKLFGQGAVPSPIPNTIANTMSPSPGEERWTSPIQSPLYLPADPEDSPIANTMPPEVSDPSPSPALLACVSIGGGALSPEEEAHLEASSNRLLSLIDRLGVGYLNLQELQSSFRSVGIDVSLEAVTSVLRLEPQDAPMRSGAAWPPTKVQVKHLEPLMRSLSCKGCKPNPEP